MVSLGELYEELAEAHAEVELAEAELREAEKAMLESDLGRIYLEAKGNLNHAEQRAGRGRAALNIAALEVYQQSSEKHPHEGVSIRINFKLQYDAERALEWAIERQPDFVIPAHLDAKRFEKYARAVRDIAPLGFVEFEESPVVAVSLNGHE